jgi:hypothetical protein
MKASAKLKEAIEVKKNAIVHGIEYGWRELHGNALKGMAMEEKIKSIKNVLDSCDKTELK